MKKSIKNSLLVLGIILCVVSVQSCKKDEGKLPEISFKTGAGYTSDDITVSAGDTVIVGIEAAKSEDEDVLKTFNVTYSYDGGSSVSFYDETLSTADEDNYDHDTQIITHNVAGTEKWEFTVSNRDGLVNTISITITTN